MSGGRIQRRSRLVIAEAANGLASRLKGAEYHLDDDIPLAVLGEIIARRATGLVRGLVRRPLLASGSSKWIFLYRDVQIRAPRQVTLGRGVTVGRGSVIDGLSQTGVEIGEGVNVGAYTIIEATGVVTDLGSGFSIGPRSAIGSFSFVGAAGGVRVGADVIMGNRVSFHSENHQFASLASPIREQGVTREGISIGDDCWIGANVTFLDGARVGGGSVIGAGAVVRGEIPPNSIALGVPARVVGVR